MINKAIYPALGVNLEGHKELLGIWLSEGVKDILIACADGLKGFPECNQHGFSEYPALNRFIEFEERLAVYI